MSQLELPLFGINPLPYHCNEVEHKKWIDKINANPANCIDCGRLIPADVLMWPYTKPICMTCYSHRQAVEQNFKPNFPYNYEEHIAQQKRDFPEYFQKVQ